MDKNALNILDSISEGIIILDNKFKIVFINNYMENIIKRSKNIVYGACIFEVFPKIDSIYFRNVFDSSVKKGKQYFFSSGIHKNVISDNLDINFKISRYITNNEIFLVIEFIDITSQSMRINQLKEYIDELFVLNEKLKEKEREIENLIYYDSLTGVRNRSFFYSFSEKLLSCAKRNDKILGLMFIDIDKFKLINDTYGHAVGDRVLIETANILTKCLRESDIVSRIGGDEFLILLSELDDYYNYEIISERISLANSKVRIKEDLEIDISLSIGVSFYPKDGTTIDELVLKADKAMYSVKRTGGNKYDCYTNGI